MSILKNLSVTSGVFFVAFVLSLVSAQNELELPPQSDLESIEDIQELLQNVQLLFETKIASKVREGTVTDDDEDEDGENDDENAMDPNGCKCSSLSCSCCQRIRVKALKIKENCCLTVTYIPSRAVIRVALTLGRRRLFSKTFSAKYPKSTCVGIPFLKKGGTICIEFYNINVGPKSFNGCIRFVAKLLKRRIAKLKLGCIRINYIDDNTKQMEAYLNGRQEELVEGPEPLYPGEYQMEEIQPANC